MQIDSEKLFKWTNGQKIKDSEVTITGKKTQAPVNFCHFCLNKWQIMNQKSKFYLIWPRSSKCHAWRGFTFCCWSWRPDGWSSLDIWGNWTWPESNSQNTTSHHSVPVNTRGSTDCLTAQQNKRRLPRKEWEVERVQTSWRNKHPTSDQILSVLPTRGEPRGHSVCNVYCWGKMYFTSWT